MNFLQFDLGNRPRGETVEITLASGANVRLMSISDFSSYKSGRSHRYIGGLAKRSPVRLQIPNSGHWYVAVDMQGLRGSTRASVRVVPGALPEIREALLTSAPLPGLPRKSRNATTSDARCVNCLARRFHRTVGRIVPDLRARPGLLMTGMRSIGECRLSL